GMERICLGVGYKMNGVKRDILPFGAEMLAECEPIYEEMPGWNGSTVGLTRFEQLPKTAQNYLERIEEICGVPIDMVSTGADREQTIVRRHPFE
ncbi:MAG: adenylosuccinate synthetase, partial [Burkholderiales bacterium]|nr:adenylosuccinate synthetase [Burkholderiales bacterium]